MARFRSLVLCYHAVSEGWPDQLAVPPTLFERHLRGLLARGYHGVSVTEVLEGRRGAMHVTFDDAYESVANALPILERLRLPATVFACSDYANDGRPLDVPELAAEVAAHPAELATMDWDALRALSERGLEIGSHTSTHPHLTRLSDSELHRELRESRSRLEDELSRPCRFLAYPYGENDVRVREAARRAGYEAAFGLRERFTAPDRYALPRADLYRRDRPLRARLKTSLLPRIPPRATMLIRRGKREAPDPEAGASDRQPD